MYNWYGRGRTQSLDDVETKAKQRWKTQGKERKKASIQTHPMDEKRKAATKRYFEKKKKLPRPRIYKSLFRLNPSKGERTKVQ